jgi:hypothetical protein
MFHLGMWRERLRNGFTDLAEGRPFTPPPVNIDELNDAELANGIGTPLADAAARSDHLLAEIIALYSKLGDKPFEWSLARTTTAAVLRNSYTHSRVHMREYLKENGEGGRGDELFEKAYEEMKAADAPPLIMGTVAYNLACVRAGEGRTDEAIRALGEALQLRPEMKEAAPKDSDLEPLHDDPRFQELVKA